MQMLYRFGWTNDSVVIFFIVTMYRSELIFSGYIKYVEKGNAWL